MPASRPRRVASPSADGGRATTSRLPPLAKPQGLRRVGRTVTGAHHTGVSAGVTEASRTYPAAAVSTKAASQRRTASHTPSTEATTVSAFSDSATPAVVVNRARRLVGGSPSSQARRIRIPVGTGPLVGFVTPRGSASHVTALYERPRRERCVERPRQDRVECRSRTSNRERLLLFEHPLHVGQLALIRDDIDPGDQVVGHAQGEHRYHRALEERDDAWLTVDDLRHQPPAAFRQGRPSPSPTGRAAGAAL